MSTKYTEYKQLDLPGISRSVLEKWQRDRIFEKSVSNREGNQSFTFYEGPPSANGLPGIHHVMARSIKDIFCRYKTLKGFQVKRKGGWDTHGLPIELSVEKTLGITKEDIGKKITVEEYNKACRKEVMKYKDIWDDLTRRMGYWVDLDNPYITFDNKYIESVWNLLGKLYEKGLLYKGYTIQPYSWAAGTGLSSHELNQPGCYRMIKDTTVVAQFKALRDGKSAFLFEGTGDHVYFLAWTTTPWTLPSNTALAVGKDIVYQQIRTFNPYTHLPVTVVLAKDLTGKYFPEQNAELGLDTYKPGDKAIPFQVIREVKGADLEGVRYEQLLPYAQPSDGDAFRVLLGDFVTTGDGTGIVHIAPSFGSDDFRVAKLNGIGSLTLVNKQGKFVDEVTDFKGLSVKIREEEQGPDYRPADVQIAIKLKEENKAFRVEKYEHSYPHCWRTDQPIIYYPLDSWFIRTTAAKDRLIELNRQINWKPESTGTGRFGNWLENLVDWNLSRSRFWGIPLPIWTTEDRSEQVCINSAEQLSSEIEKAVRHGFMKQNPVVKTGDGIEYNSFDLHRPYVDDIVLVSPSGQKMHREPDLIDVWFDSGAMPYAQWHYPFENRGEFEKSFPADFIAEGVDQTRGWFFTLHAIAVLLFDSIAFRNVISNGLVLDKNGNKMSKRLGNAVDPFETLSRYGADATRWYMISNAQPWDNLKFNIEGITEVQRKFFGTLHNTYAFFALYANIDRFTYTEAEIPLENRQEIDRWILSVLNSLIREVDQAYADYEPTKAARAIQAFVSDHLSNWYVRLCRRRFWKGDYSEDKIAAYQTLYTCLETVALLSSPVAPFYADVLFTDLNRVTGRSKAESVHLADFPVHNELLIDKPLEERMELAQNISSLVLSLRKKVNIKVRQPLNKMLLPILNDTFREQVEKVRSLILSEVNVKDIEYITDTSGILVKKIRPNFKALGPKAGNRMKELSAAVAAMSQEDISSLEREGSFTLQLSGAGFSISADDVEILSEDIPGWQVATLGRLTVALDISITPALKEEGISRELVNRIQNIRKEKEFEVTDKIVLKVQQHEAINTAISNNLNYICNEILATSIELVDKVKEEEGILVEVDDDIKTLITINKLN
jgi:isoleucyl-tRNA synthetase